MYVHMHAIVSKSNVKEVRRSARTMLHCTIKWQFIQTFVRDKWSTIGNGGKRERVKRVKDQERVALFSGHVLNLNSNTELAMANVSPNVFGQVRLDMSSDKNKTRADELQNQIVMYERGSKKEWNVNRTEDNPNGMLLTPEMGGKIVLSVLQKGTGGLPIDCTFRLIWHSGCRQLMFILRPVLESSYEAVERTFGSFMCNSQKLVKC